MLVLVQAGWHTPLHMLLLLLPARAAGRERANRGAREPADEPGSSQRAAKTPVSRRIIRLHVLELNY
jgi:hypothetical protein